MTKERPILFSGPMVRAILEGKKTQTRRAAKQPAVWTPFDFYAFKEGDPYPWYFRRKDAVWDSFKTMDELAAKYSPYGKVGDRLWVRETWCNEVPGCPGGLTYRADHVHPSGDGPTPIKWKPSIFMPRKASRILLEISKVRLEPLNAISEADAIAEGIEAQDSGLNLSNIPVAEHFDVYRHYGKSSLPVYGQCPIKSYQSLWESINGKKHPWDSTSVWTYDFCRVASND